MTTQDKATPRPWRVKAEIEHEDGYGDRVVQYIAVETPNHCDKHIARIMTWGSLEPEPESIANAHMIVAAVNALPALVEAAKYTADLIQGGDRFNHMEPWAQDVVSRLRAAINALEVDQELRAAATRHKPAL